MVAPYCISKREEREQEVRLVAGDHRKCGKLDRLQSLEEEAVKLLIPVANPYL